MDVERQSHLPLQQQLQQQQQQLRQKQEQQEQQQEPPDLLSGGDDVVAVVERDVRRPDSTTAYVAMADGGDAHNDKTTTTAAVTTTMTTETQEVDTYMLVNVPPVRDYLDGAGDFDEEYNNKPSTGSVADSVLTAEGIQDLKGFCCVCLVMFIGDMSRGVMFPSMWPLVKELGGNEVTLGYSVASFSFGRALVNPAFGYMSNEKGYTKTLLLSSSILLFGTLFYAQVQNIGHPEALIVAQTILGIGSGTLGVTRAFVADVTAKRQRTRYMGLITAVQYGGFTVTPIFGAMFNYFLEDVDVQWGIFRWNMYTAPAYFMGSVVLCTIVVLFIFFRDRKRHVTMKDTTSTSSNKTQRRMQIDELANTKPWISCLSVYDLCILGCMLLNVSTKGSIASFETLGIAIAQQHFNMMSARAGAIVASCGTLGVISLLCLGHLEALFTDVQLINGGMIVMAIGILSLASIEHREANENPGWKYALAMFLIYSIGYPIGHTCVIGLFSKIVGRRPQGTLLGWFASAGSFARMLFPIVSGYIARYRDLETLFLLLTCVLLVSTGVVLIFRKTLNLLAS